MFETHHAVIEIDVTPEYTRRILAMAKNVAVNSLNKYSDREILTMCLNLICEPYAIKNIEINEYL